jgi:hypothetical protein
VVRTAEIPGVVFERIADRSPHHAVFGADEISEWPDWVLVVLSVTGLFQETARAAQVFCNGCEWSCLKPIVVRTLPNGRKSRAFVACDEEPDQGRVEVPLERLKRYIATIDSAARLVGRSLGLKSSIHRAPDGSLAIGRVKGRHGYRVLSVEPRDGDLLLSAGGHRVSLSELVHLADRALAIDSQAIQRLVNRKTARSGPEYAPLAERSKHGRRKKSKRDQQIRLEATRLKSQNKNWSVTRISEHISRTPLAGGISAARVRRIIYEKNS